MQWEAQRQIWVHVNKNLYSYITIRVKLVVYKNENIFNVSIGYRNTTGSLRYKGGSGKLQATKESSHSFSVLFQTSISIPWTQGKHTQYNNSSWLQGAYKLGRHKTSYILNIESWINMILEKLISMNDF